MSWGHRVIGGILGGLGTWLLVGCCCSGGKTVTAPPVSQLHADLTPPVGQPRLSRAQLTEGGPTLARPTALPPGAAESTSGTQQTSLLRDSSVRVKVSAWVNGKPIFDDEVMQVVGPVLRSIYELPEPQRSEKIAEVLEEALEQLIDQEVMYQEAVKKLEKNSPRTLDKLKQISNQEFDKHLRKIREAGVPEEHIREIEHIARKLLERNLISGEYVQSRIIPYIESVVSLEQIREYYESHKNEFQSVDKVQWQDVFIAVGPKHPTVTDARKFAAELLAKCRTPDDFTKLIEFDDGDSKFRGGEGLGQLRGEIKPAELEPYLFELKEGQLGPIVEFEAGVHIFRVVKREYAGQIPLNDETQQAIRKKLESRIREREYKRVVRELRSRSVIRIEKNEK